MASISFILMLGILQCLTLHGISSEVDLVYLDEMCGKSITVSSDVVVNWTQTYDPLPAGQVCTLDIQLDKADPKNNMMGFFSYFVLDTKYTPDPVLYTCPFVYMQLLKNGIPQMGTGQCLLLTFSLFDLGGVGDKIQLSYQVGNMSEVVPGNFTFILTSMFQKAFEGDCPKDYFDCQIRDRCVKKSVVCNGYPDCAQPLFSEDEEDCISSSGLSIIEIVAISVGSVLGLLLIAGVITVIIKRAFPMSQDAYSSW